MYKQVKYRDFRYRDPTMLTVEVSYFIPQFNVLTQIPNRRLMKSIYMISKPLLDVDNIFAVAPNHR